MIDFSTTRKCGVVGPGTGGRTCDLPKFPEHDLRASGHHRWTWNNAAVVAVGFAGRARGAQTVPADGGGKMSIHVKGCRCEACLEGRNEQHVAGCLCADCREREAHPYGQSSIAADLLGAIGGRVRKAVRAAEAVKDVLTPRERDAIARFIRGRM